MVEPGFPKTWGEAIPYVVWIVLILGFGLELATALVHGEWLRALIAFAAMVGLMAVVLHWPQLSVWASNISPNWVVAAAFTLLFVITSLPFIEEKRWPFSVWFASPSWEQVNALGTQLATAKKELNDAQQQIAREPAERAALLAKLQSELQASRGELEDTKSQLRAPRPAPASRPEIIPPIAWEPLVLDFGNDGNSVSGIVLRGMGTRLAKITDAAIISELTGAKQSLQAIIYGSKEAEFVPVNELNDVANGARITLIAKFPQQLQFTDFMGRWGKLGIEIKYDDNETYKQSFGENYIRQYIMKFFPGAEIGPRITRSPQ